MAEINKLFFLITIMVIVTSWNCNGLCNINKLKMIFSLLDEKKYDIIGLQETHWVDEFIENYKHLWKGRIIYNNSNKLKMIFSLLDEKKYDTK